MTSIDQIINELELLPHPEGGYYKETYRSVGEIHPNSLDNTYSGKRNYSTCIYFLLTSDTFSAFHRIIQDEIWHFYEGSPLVLHTISEDGSHTEHTIGRDFSKGQVPQLVVSGGDWFASKIKEESSYTLLGCTVAPGFNFDDFELPSRTELVAKFPQHEELITELTHH